MHFRGKTTFVAVDAAHTAQGTLLLLRIRAVMAIYAVEFATKGALLADGLAGDDAEPFLVFFTEFGIVLVRAGAVIGFEMAAAAADIML